MSITSLSLHSNADHKTAISALSADLDRAESRVKTLQADKRKLEQESTKQKLISSRLEQKLSVLEGDIAAKDDKVATYKEQLHLCETRLFELQIRAKDETSALRDKVELSKKLESTTVRLNKRCEDLERDAKQMSEDNTYLSANLQSVQEENDELHARLTQQTEAMFSRDLAREESRKKISELTSEVQKLRFELEDSQTENTNLKNKQKDFEEALIKSDGSLNYTRELAEEEQEKSSRKISELTDLVRELEHERRDMEMSLNTAEDSHAQAERDLNKRERMRRNLQSKLSHLVSMLYATLPGIKVIVPRVMLTLNDEGESTDVEYSESTHGSTHAPLPTDETSIDVESVRQAILAIKKQAAIHDSECTELKASLKVARESSASAGDSANRLSRENNLLKEKVAGLEREKDVYRGQLDSSKGSMQTLEESRRELQTQIDILEQQKNEATHQQQRLERECHLLRGKVGEGEEEIAEMKKSRDIANSEIDTLITKFDMLKKHKDQLEGEKASINRQLKDVSEERAVLESRLENIHQTLEQSEKEKTNLQQDIGKLQKTSTGTQDKLRNLEETMASLEKRLKSYKDENTELQQKLSAANTEASNLRREKDLLEEKQTSLLNDGQALSQKMSDQQEKINKLQGTATDNEMARIKVEGQIRSANLALQQKSCELRTQNNKLELLTTENKHLQSTVSSVTAKVNQLEREKRDMNENILSLQTEKKLNLQSKTSLEKQIASIQDTLREREESLRAYETKLTTSTVANDKTKREMKKLESLMDDKEEGSKSKIQRLEEKFKCELERERRIARDKDKIITSEQERAEALRKKINDLQDQIATLNVTVHRQEATKKSFQDRINDKTVENKDLRSLLNETYSLQDDHMTSRDMISRDHPASSTRLSYTPERLDSSPDSRFRSPDRSSALSPDARSTPALHRRRSISPSSRRRISPVSRLSPTRHTRYRSPSPPRRFHTPARTSPYSKTVNMSEDVRKDLSNITERTEDKSSNISQPSLGQQDHSSLQGKSLEVDATAGLKCLRCRSPIGLTLA